MVAVHTPAQIKAAIADLHLLSTDDLSHNYKCALTRDTRLYKSFIDAIERELRKRRHLKEPIDDPDIPTDS